MKILSRLLVSATFVILAIPNIATAQQQQAPENTRSEGIRWADKFAGSSPTNQINAAIADCGAYTGAPGNSCLVVIPPSMGCGEPRQAPDNVLLWDLRGCAQSQGMRFNLSRAATGHVRSKFLLQDNFTLDPSTALPETSSATLYVRALPDSSNNTKGTVAAINGSINTNSLTGNFVGNLVGIEGEAGAALAHGGPFMVRDIRGGTFNTDVGNGINAVDVTSLYAQAPFSTKGGSISNAYSLRAEGPTAGTVRNLAGWFNGDVQIDTNLVVRKSIKIGEGSAVTRISVSRGTLEFGPINGHSCHEKSLPGEGADTKGAVIASPSGSLNSDNLLWSAYVSTSGMLVVHLCNVGDITTTPATVSWNATIIQ